MCHSFLKTLSGGSFRPRLKVDFSREFVCCCLISWRSHQPGNSLTHIFVSRFTRSPGTVNLDCRSHVRARAWWRIFRGDCLLHEVTRFEKSDLLAVPWRQPAACYVVNARVKVKSLSRVQLCDPVDCSPPGSSVPGILQARILEWVVISFSRGSSWPRDRTQVSRTAGRRFNLWATGEALVLWWHCTI